MKKILLLSSTFLFIACGEQREGSGVATINSMPTEARVGFSENSSEDRFLFQCYSPNNVDDRYWLKIESHPSKDGDAIVSLLHFDGRQWIVTGTPERVRQVVVPAPEGDDVRFVSNRLFIIVRPYQRPAPGIHSGEYQAEIRGELPPRSFSKQTEISCDPLYDYDATFVRQDLSTALPMLRTAPLQSEASVSSDFHSILKL